MLALILILPLISFGFISCFLLKRKEEAAGLSVGIAIVNAVLTLRAVSIGNVADCCCHFTWLNVDNLQITIGFSWDKLARLMLIIVTGVGALIHIYSLGYMKDDDGKARFFAYLSLFMFSMIGIVLASNFIMMFIFWELVGLSSYLLIGFWYEKASAADAGKKAFLVNKLGDFGFMLGIIWTWKTFGTIDFTHLSSLISSQNIPTLLALLLFCGAVGKSAQFPLHVWLPDAMEGPTPVSALIHAATMVAAGVYMLCRIFFILEGAPEALTVIAWIGGITALFAALWAIGQDDIKRILAYSTLSQLGYMVMAVGLGDPKSAMFHLSTHACFKALLFLAAGSVIIALHHEQNIWKMGGLWSKMRWTSITFLIGLLALCGIPFFAGSLSKDEILVLAFHENRPLFYIGAFTAFLTAFYMSRLFLVAFLVEARDHAAQKAHENGFIILLPLLILAFFSFSFFWNNPFLQEYLASIGEIHETETAFLHLFLILIPVLGIGSALTIYNRNILTDPIGIISPLLRKFLASKFYFDEFYDNFLIRYFQDGISRILSFVDKWIIDGLFVKLFASLGALCFGNFIRCFQTGNLQTYAIYFALALGGLVYWVITQ